jgi:hypothetical protein
MSITIDVTEDLTSAANWGMVMKTVTQKMWDHRANDDNTEITVYIPHYLRDAFLNGWASSYLCSQSFLSTDNLRTRLIKWIARFLGVSISHDEQRILSPSQEAIQRLCDEMNERDSLIISGIWISMVPF